MINQYDFSLKNEKQIIGDSEHELNFGADEGKQFRYKDFSARQAEQFAIILLNLIPEEVRASVQEVAENSSNYDGVALLMSSSEYSILTSPECVNFLNSELKRFELYSKIRDCYEPLTLEKIDNEIESMATLSYLRAKLLKVFGDFFTKGNL